MRRFIGIFAVLAALTPPAAAHADPDIPDIDSYPEAESSVFLVPSSLSDGLEVFPRHWFATPIGLDCLAVRHRAMFYIDCYGNMPGSPRANHVEMPWDGPVVFDDAAEGKAAKETELGKPPLLPAGQRFVVAGARCATTEEAVFVCAKGPVAEGRHAGRHGFAVPGGDGQGARSDRAVY